jgi:hypothetical protein
MLRPTALFFVLLLPFTAAWADKYHQTITVFQKAGESGHYFQKAYGYAVFPSIGKAVCRRRCTWRRSCVRQQQVGRQYVDDTGHRRSSTRRSGTAKSSSSKTNARLTNSRAAISNLAPKQAPLRLQPRVGGRAQGSSATASGGRNDAATAGAYHKGMAVFTVAKGGLMYAATIGGQKYGYKKI